MTNVSKHHCTPIDQSVYQRCEEGYHDRTLISTHVWTHRLHVDCYSTLLTLVLPGFTTMFPELLGINVNRGSTWSVVSIRLMCMVSLNVLVTVTVLVST
jgi:hypothetical protein